MANSLTKPYQEYLDLKYIELEFETFETSNRDVFKTPFQSP